MKFLAISLGKFIEFVIVSSMAFKIRSEEIASKQVKAFGNVRLIIDCLKLFIQKPKIHSSQKTTLSSYKRWNSAKMLVGVTPSGFISFIPLLWPASLISGKEITKQFGQLHLLEEGDAVMSEKGFLISDISSLKKVILISPAHCREPQLSSKGKTYTHHCASLCHVLKEIL